MREDTLERNYTVIDSGLFDGIRWWLYEDKELGDEAPSIATNGDKYVYTWEDLTYTVEHLYEEYEIYYLD